MYVNKMCTIQNNTICKKCIISFYEFIMEFYADRGQQSIN